MRIKYLAIKGIIFCKMVLRLFYTKIHSPHRVHIAYLTQVILDPTTL